MRRPKKPTISDEVERFVMVNIDLLEEARWDEFLERLQNFCLHLAERERQTLSRSALRIFQGEN